MNADDEAAALLEQLVAVGTPRRAAGEKAYLKSSLQFVCSGVPAAVAYTHLTLPTSDLVAISEGALSLTHKDKET